MVTLIASRTETAATHTTRPLSDDATEFYHYEDNGCEVSESCLDCPLPQCKYDNPGWYKRNRKLARDFRVLHIMEQESLTIRETAERFSITPRTVSRVVQRCREATAHGYLSGWLQAA